MSDSARDLPPPARKFLEKVRVNVAEQGYETTPDELLEMHRTIDAKLLDATGLGMVEYMQLKAMYDETPPPPPYKGLFDDLAEAEAFRKRAVAAHGCRLQIVTSPDGRRHRLVEVSDRKTVNDGDNHASG